MTVDEHLQSGDNGRIIVCAVPRRAGAAANCSSAVWAATSVSLVYSAHRDKVAELLGHCKSKGYCGSCVAGKRVRRDADGYRKCVHQ